MAGILKEGVDPTDFGIDDLNIPNDIGRRIVLNAMGQDPADWLFQLPSGEVVEGIPAIGIEYTSEEAAHRAVLSAMGHSVDGTTHVVD